MQLVVWLVNTAIVVGAIWFSCHEFTGRWELSFVPAVLCMTGAAIGSFPHCWALAIESALLFVASVLFALGGGLTLAATSLSLLGGSAEQIQRGTFDYRLLFGAAMFALAAMVLTGIMRWKKFRGASAK